MDFSNFRKWFFSIDLNSRESLFLQHSAVISLFSPIASLYQTSKLFNQPFRSNLRHVPSIFLPQIALRYTQTSLSTDCKDTFNPLIAFGLIGILQGGVYGHSNLYFSDKMNISHSMEMRNYFKGPVFAATRDVISQGLPFYLTPLLAPYTFQKSITKQYINENSNQWDELAILGGLSIISTYLSHPFHCLQTFIQNEPKSTQIDVAKKIIGKYKWTLFYKGITGRLFLLLITNFSNHMFLRRLWNE
jgi:hypothetical protein